MGYLKFFSVLLLFFFFSEMLLFCRETLRCGTGKVVTIACHEMKLVVQWSGFPALFNVDYIDLSFGKKVLD